MAVTNQEQWEDLVYVALMGETVSANLLCLRDSAINVWMELIICRTTMFLDAKVCEL